MFKKIINSLKIKIKGYPMISFFIALFFIFVIIFVGNLIRKPDEEKKDNGYQAKETETFTFGDTPYLNLSAKVEKDGIITINATTNGIVKYINTYEGHRVSPGTTLISLTDTYGGANISSVDKEIAQVTQNTQDITYGKNEDTLDYQRNLVPKTNSDANTVARKQVTVQKRNLDLAKNTIDLNLKKAKIIDSLNYPCAPTYGVVERIYVKPGQQVQVGTPLVSFVSDDNIGTAEILISLQIAKIISVDDISYIHINGKKIMAHPIYISKESTSDQHYTILYSIPNEYMDMIANKSFVNISVPLENRDDNNFVPMIPIDAVQLTQDSSYVFLLINDKAESREIKLGNVYGQFVQVVEGISTDDEIILNRNVFHGDQVSKIEK